MYLIIFTWCHKHYDSHVGYQNKRIMVMFLSRSVLLDLNSLQMKSVSFVLINLHMIEIFLIYDSYLNSGKSQVLASSNTCKYQNKWLDFCFFYLGFKWHASFSQFFGSSGAAQFSCWFCPQPSFEGSFATGTQLL